MQLLVTTPLQVLLVDTDSGMSSTIRAGDGYYYGISSQENTIVLTHFGGHLGFYSNSSNKTRFSADHLDDPHQVEWVNENCLLVANSGKNCISVFDVQGELIQDIYLNEIRIDDKKNRTGNHFNSVHKVGNRVYVVAHNYEKPSEVWELGWPELQVEKKWPSQATWAHNIWLSDMGLVICNTKNGNLYEIKTKEVIWQSEDKFLLTRGLAVYQNYIFVGCSTFSPRKQRYWNTSSIWIIDRKTLRTIDKIILPGSGEIREIRIIDFPDECHNDQIITRNMIGSLKRVNKLVDMAYWLRRQNSYFQRNVPLLSQVVRSKQIASIWGKNIKQILTKNKH